jgi:hypothetical protein
LPERHQHQPRLIGEGDTEVSDRRKTAEFRTRKRLEQEAINVAGANPGAAVVKPMTPASKNSSKSKI